MKKKLWLPSVLFSLLILGLCIFSYLHLDKNNAGKNFDQLCREIFYNELDGDTLSLHYTLAYPEDYGFQDYAVTFGTILPEPENEFAILTENYLKRLREIPLASLNEERQLTYEILQDTLENQLESSDLLLYNELLSPSSGVQGQLPVLLAEYTFRKEQDIEDYLSLLSKVPDYFKEICEFQELRAQEGIVMTDDSLERVMEQCQDMLSNRKTHFLSSTFLHRIEDCEFLSQSQKTEYIRLNEKVLEDHFFPAYEQLLAFLPDLMGRGSNPNGLCYYPDGKKYYQTLVGQYTGTDYTVEDLKVILEKQWEKEISRLKKAASAGSGKQANKEPLPQDPTMILEDLKQKIAADFPALPDTSYSVKYVDPALEPYLSPAFYLTPPLDDFSENTIYINNDTGYEGLELYTTLAHEGYPGHLYQTVYQNSLDLDPIRSLLYYGGYVEGWGLYVEMYAYDWAGISPDMAALERANHSLLLCLYSMLDICIHYDGYSLTDVEELLSSFGSYSDTSLQSLYRYIAEEPGTYLKYYIGYLELLELRERAEKALGDEYSPKAFHEFILSIGPAPFPIIRERQDMWLKHILSLF